MDILLSNGSCRIKCQLCISICFRLGTDERYCVTKGKICVFGFCFCSRACFLSSKIISERVFETRVSGYHHAMRFVLKCFIAVLKADIEKLVRRSLSALPLMKPWFARALNSP